MCQPKNRNEEGGGPFLTKVAIIMLLCLLLSLIALPYAKASEVKDVSPEGWAVCATLASIAGFPDLADSHATHVILAIGNGYDTAPIAYEIGLIEGFVFGMSMGSGKPVEQVAMETYQSKCPPVI